ncbi:uncharacterized protein LOC111832078 [Capsella rubella]|uniref:uncharacterized protein LOC111832078 n=1 Tax=Capsella rubella TaxID=81985 RepID=UPI000CD5BACB|nr:uncharacterized protein LOC111832078 [Capsella rubella]
MSSKGKQSESSKQSAEPEPKRSVVLALPAASNTELGQYAYGPRTSRGRGAIVQVEQPEDKRTVAEIDEDIFRELGEIKFKKPEYRLPSIFEFGLENGWAEKYGWTDDHNWK